MGTTVRILRWSLWLWVSEGNPPSDAMGCPGDLTRGRKWSDSEVGKSPLQKVMRLRQKHNPGGSFLFPLTGLLIVIPPLVSSHPKQLLVHPSKPSRTLQNCWQLFTWCRTLFGAILMKPLKISPRQELLLKQSSYMACSRLYDRQRKWENSWHAQGLYDQEEGVWRLNSTVRHLHQPVTHSDKDQEWLLRWLNWNPVVNLTVASSHTCTCVCVRTHTHTHNTLFMNLKSQPLSFYLFFSLFQITHLSSCQSDPISGFQGT